MALLVNMVKLCRVSSVSSSLLTSRSYHYETLTVSTPSEFVYHVQLNRPSKRNAMNKTMWTEMGDCFQSLAADEDCRSILLSGTGKAFASGIDLNELFSIAPMLNELEDVARKHKFMMSFIKPIQDNFTAVEKCVKPIISLVHGSCIGIGMDLICATDIRLCSEDAVFSVREVDLGLAADIGTLQRLPRIIGSDSLVRELCYTGRDFYSSEAKDCGLVSGLYSDYERLVGGGLALAQMIASKSPVAVQGTKANLLYSRDHSVEDGLAYMRMWNATMLQSEDLVIAATALMSKSKPEFSKL